MAFKFALLVVLYILYASIPSSESGSRGICQNVAGPPGMKGEPGMSENGTLQELADLQEQIDELKNLSLKGEPGVPGQNGTPGEMGEKGCPGEPWGSGGCPGVTLHLPRDDQDSDYVRYLLPVPSFQDVTMCAWIESSDFDNDATVLSYVRSATTDNEFTVRFQSPTVLQISVRGIATDFTIDELVGLQKLHICVWFSSASDEIALYINGNLTDAISANIRPIRWEGHMILGQKQSDLDAQGLDSTQAFSGNITNFLIWPRVLSHQEIYDIAYLCLCPYDYAIAMILDRVRFFGDAGYSPNYHCYTV